ncbi:MAG: hypothetical protein PHV61_05635 [Limnochordia bacterium]|nr:hypothetical protein [Limnochordia bacterium]MDD2629634.1 hypothetical protein [Limnochordia bacterium]MDD4518029.1 hypothetical protein [Limnochordia bacterium]
MKKLVSIVLATAMVALLAVPAIAGTLNFNGKLDMSLDYTKDLNAQEGQLTPSSTLKLNFTGAENGKNGVFVEINNANELTYPFPAGSNGQLNWKPAVTKAKLVIPGAYRKGSAEVTTHFGNALDIAYSKWVGTVGADQPGLRIEGSRINAGPTELDVDGFIVFNEAGQSKGLQVTTDLLGQKLTGVYVEKDQDAQTKDRSMHVAGSFITENLQVAGELARDIDDRTQAIADVKGIITPSQKGNSSVEVWYREVPRDENGNYVWNAPYQKLNDSTIKWLKDNKTGVRVSANSALDLRNVPVSLSASHDQRFADEVYGFAGDSTTALRAGAELFNTSIAQTVKFNSNANVSDEYITELARAIEIGDQSIQPELSVAYKPGNKAIENHVKVKNVRFADINLTPELWVDYNHEAQDITKKQVKVAANTVVDPDNFAPIALDGYTLMDLDNPAGNKSMLTATTSQELFGMNLDITGRSVLAFNEDNMDSKLAAKVKYTAPNSIHFQGTYYWYDAENGTPWNQDDLLHKDDVAQGLNLRAWKSIAF